MLVQIFPYLILDLPSEEMDSASGEMVNSSNT